MEVVDVELDAPLEPIMLRPGRPDALVIVRWRGELIGQFTATSRNLANADEQLAAVEAAIGPHVRHRLLEVAVERALRGDRKATPAAAGERVSVVVDATNDPASLPDCIAALRALRTAPTEIVVADRRSNDHIATLCAQLEVRHWPARAGSRPSLSDPAFVALTDSNCTVEPGWLDDLGLAFADPLVMAVAGPVVPRELETPAQIALENARGLVRAARRDVVDGASDSFGAGFIRPAAAAAEVGSGANLIVRREVVDGYGLHIGERAAIPVPSTGELETFMGLLLAGYRIALDPTRSVRFGYPRSPTDLMRAVSGASADSTAFAAGRLLDDRRLDGIRAASRLPFSVSALPGSGRASIPLAIARIGSAVSGAFRPSPPQPLPALRMGDVATPRDPPALPEQDLPSALDAAVCIPSHGRPEKLMRLLDHLQSQTHPANRFEVVVVIDGGAAESASAVRALQTRYRLRVVEQPHRGVAAARNACAENATAPLLIFLDDDMVPEPGLVAEHVRGHERADVNLVALGYCPASETATNLWAQLVRARWEDHFTRKQELDHPWSWIDFSVGNSSLRIELFNRTGGFDEDFTSRNEDQELGARLAEQGVDFKQLPAARAWHDFDAKLEDGLMQTRRQAFFDVMLVRKHPHLTDRVNLRRWARAGRLRPKAALIYRLAPVAGVGLRMGARLADVLELLDCRRSWWRLTRQLMVASYVLGMHDALPTQRRLRRALGSGADNPRAVVDAELGKAATLTVPPVGSELDVEISLGARTVARVPAMRFGLEWSWPDLIERTTSAAERMLPTLSLEEARRLAGGPEGSRKAGS